MLAMQEQHFYIGYNQIISKQCFGFWFFGLFVFFVFLFFLGGGGMKIGGLDIQLFLPKTLFDMRFSEQFSGFHIIYTLIHLISNVKHCLQPKKISKLIVNL